MNMTLQCTTLTEYMHAATKPHTYMACAACGDVDCFKLLLGRGSNIQETNNNRRNSMHLAVLNHRLPLLSRFA